MLRLRKRNCSEAPVLDLTSDVLDSALREVAMATFTVSHAGHLPLRTIMAARITLALVEGERDPKKLKQLALRSIEDLY